MGSSSKQMSYKRLQKALQPLADAQKQQADRLSAIQSQLSVLNRNVNLAAEAGGGPFCHRDLFLVAMVLAVQLVMLWMFR